MVKVLNIMTIYNKIIKGFAIETINPETGEVEWWEYNKGKKISRESLLAFLPRLGWSYGDSLFLKEEGDLTRIYTDNLNYAIAVISTSLAKSLRREPYVFFIKEKTNC